MSDDTNNLRSLFSKPLEIQFDEEDDVVEDDGVVEVADPVQDVPQALNSPSPSPSSVQYDVPTPIVRNYSASSPSVLRNDPVQYDIPPPPTAINYNAPVRPILRKYPVPASVPKKKGKVDLSFAEVLNVNSGFSLFNQKHKEMAAKLTQHFLDVPDMERLLKRSRKKVNVFLCQYAFMVAYYHRSDKKDFNLPSIVEMFPDQFFDPTVFSKAREEQELHSEEVRMQIPLTFNFTASEKEVEQRMAYFREDVGVNSQYWNWHIVNPKWGDHSIVAKDRRGELFYYMHNQIINRYNVDRMCNNLQRVKPLNDLRLAISEAYFPKLVRCSDYQALPARVANCYLSDINRVNDNIVAELADIERWRDRIYTAMDQGYVTSEYGEKIYLTDPDGIDILGNVVEGNSLSPNRQLYGSVNDQGHLVISLVHDPDQKYLEDFGVMGYVHMAMRDPVFYRWHSFINSMFVRHKKNLFPYDPELDLKYNEVAVTSIEVKTKIEKNKPKPKKNILSTYWKESVIDIGTNGLEYTLAKGTVSGRFTHLQHDPFIYKIVVENSSSEKLFGTCRIFLCPRKDERGSVLKFEEQRKLMIEMDKFTVCLNPGSNQIKRRSRESSVTVPSERFGVNEPPVVKNVSDETTQEEDSTLCGPEGKDACDCGWPQHMLLPKGSPTGTEFDIFVMITNYDSDHVDQPDYKSACNAASYCGLKGQMYPDKRPMGFPFDRPYDVDHLIDFKNLGTNMAIGQCMIQFKPKTN